MKKSRLITLALSALCAACVYGPQQVRVAPELHLTQAIDGAGKTVRLSVADERASKSLGQTDEGADFTLQGKLPNVIESAIRTALEKQGFIVARTSRKTAANLHVEIMDLEYNVKPGFIFKAIRADSRINAICKTSSGKDFVRLYTGRLEKTVFFLGKDGNGEYLSTAVSKAIDKLLNDQDMGACLVE